MNFINPSENPWVVLYNFVISYISDAQTRTNFHEKCNFKGLLSFSGISWIIIHPISMIFDTTINYDALASSVHYNLFQHEWYDLFSIPVNSMQNDPLCGSFCVISNHMWGIFFRKRLKTSREMIFLYFQLRMMKIQSDLSDCFY